MDKSIEKLPTDAEFDILKVLCSTHTPLKGSEIVDKSNGRVKSKSVFSLIPRMTAKNLVYQVQPAPGEKVSKYRPTGHGMEVCKALLALV